MMIVVRPRSGETICHRDGTVTHFDIFRQCWVRERHLSDQVFSSMGEQERERVIRHVEKHSKEEK